VWTVAILVGLAVAAVGTAVDYSLRARLPRPPLVMLAPLTRGAISGTIRATGTIEPIATATLSQPFSARITEITVAPGDRVARGDVIVRFDPLVVRAELARAEARLVAAEVAAFEAEVALARVVRAGSPGPTYEGPFDDRGAAKLEDDRGVAEARALATAAEVAALEASHRLSFERSKRGVLRAPFDGIVLSRAANPGETVVAGRPILSIGTDLDRVHLVAEVPEAEIARVKAGQAVRFVAPAYPGRVFEATVVRAGQLSGAPGVRHFPVTLIVQDPARALKPGMTASVELETKGQGAVFRVPVAALGFRPRQWGASSSDERTLWFADGVGGSLLRTSVEVGVTDGAYAEVRAPGLREGALVAIDYAQGTEGR
jgi:HlyD family secretion protein